MAKIHVIAHTHWDREWYFTQQDSDVLATYNFTKVIETLENNENYICYHLDGQSAIVEDYLKTLPHMRERLAHLVKNKRLFIGPWYTQTDTFNVSGESIIRNLKYGMHIAQSLGHSMKVGYLPDTFGHNAQMPTIFSGMGIDNIIFWRGIDYDQHVKKSQFIWRSIGGDEIYAFNLLHGYGAAKNIIDTSEHLNNKIFPMVEKIKALSGLNEVLLPSGGDQVNIDDRLPAILKEATNRSLVRDEYIISSMENFVDYLRQHQDVLEKYQGEFKTPRYARIHKTIGSVRYDIKKLNFEIEQFLTKKLEIVIAIAKSQNIQVHTELLDTAWKKILECHAHDSMGGCNSDATNSDIMHRLKQAQEIAHGLYNLVIKEIVEPMDDNDIVFFNNQIIPFSGIAKAVIFSSYPSISLYNGEDELPIEISHRETIDGGKIIEVTKDGEKEVSMPPYYRFEVNVQVEKLPPMGYVTYQVKSNTCQNIFIQNTSQTFIENDKIKISYCKGILELEDKVSGRKITNLLRLEDQADAGDSYDFSPLIGDTPNYNSMFDILDVKLGDTEQTMRLMTRIQVATDLDSRQNKQFEQTQDFELTLSLYKGNSQLFVDVNTLNNVKDHRVRILINSDIYSNSSISTLPFACIERPIDPNLADWQQKYRECPIDIETTEGAIAFADNNKAMIINGRGLKEFQVLKQDNGVSQCAITLFKSTGILGRDDLAWRPGRASGINNTVIHTPDAQLQEHLQFSFSITLTNDAKHQTIRKLENEYLNIPFMYQKQTLNSFEHRLERFQVRFDKRKKQEVVSLFNLDVPLELSSISPSFYKKNAVILRLYNATENDVYLYENNFAHFAQVEVVNYREELIEDENKPKNFSVKPNNTIDLRLTFSNTGE